MPLLNSSRSIAPSSSRSVAVAALMGFALLAAPMTAAWAEAPVSGLVQMAQAKTTPAGKAATDTKPETVEARIAKLHTDLKITAAEQPKWDAVAKTMRDNAAAMDKLVASKRAIAPEKTTAVDDLLTYQEFAKAHLDGLTELTTSFKALYEAMSPAQKKNADTVFETFGRDPAHKQG